VYLVGFIIRIYGEDFVAFAQFVKCDEIGGKNWKTINIYALSVI